MQDPNTYDNERRFIFNNWSTEDFIGTWAGVSQTIKSGETVELPMYKAYHYCKHFVNREMDKAHVTVQDSQEARQPFEVKTIAEITGAIDSPALASIKEKIKEEIEIESGKKAKKETKTTKVKEEESSKEFEDIK